VQILPGKQIYCVREVNHLYGKGGGIAAAFQALDIDFSVNIQTCLPM